VIHILGARGTVGRLLCEAAKRLGIPYSAPQRPYDAVRYKAGGTAFLAFGRANQEECRKYPEETRAVNVAQTLECVVNAVLDGALPVIFSSPMVFRGLNGNYGVDDHTAPITEYGRQKKALEERCNPETVATVRIGPLVAPFSGNCAVEAMYRMLEKERPQLARDTCMNLTDGEELAEALLRNLQHPGILHVCSPYTYSHAELGFWVRAHSTKGATLAYTMCKLEELALPEPRPRLQNLVPSAGYSLGSPLPALLRKVKWLENR